MAGSAGCRDAVPDARAAGSPGTVLVSGYAEAPKSVSMHAVYGRYGVVLEVDTATHRVVASDCTVVTGLAHAFLQRLLLGANVLEDAETVAAEIKHRYLVPASPAMIVALKAAIQRYREGLLVNDVPRVV